MSSLEHLDCLEEPWCPSFQKDHGRKLLEPHFPGKQKIFSYFSSSIFTIFLLFLCFIFKLSYIFSFCHIRSGENLIKVDLTDTDNIDKFIQETKPDVLIHSAAQRFPDQIQKNPESARKLNVDATMKMAASMSKFFLKVVFS